MIRRIILAFLLSVTPLLAQVTDYRKIQTPPLRTFTVDQPKRIALSNGMVIFLMEDHELPLIRGSALIHGGSRDVPADKTGLVGILGSSWRTGGTESKTGDQLDDILEARAARVETGGGEDSTRISLDVLKGDFDFVFLDAGKRDYLRFFDLVFPRLRVGGLFLAHNVVNKEGEMRPFLAAIQSNPRLITSIVRPSSEGIELTGHHEVLLPLLHALVACGLAALAQPAALARAA